MQELDYKTNIDQKVTFQGTAKNARLGAIVMTSDYTPIYMDALRRWEKDVLGKLVEVSGTLRRKGLAPKAVVNAAGEVSHGIDDDSYVLENPTWVVKE